MSSEKSNEVEQIISMDFPANKKALIKFLRGQGIFSKYFTPLDNLLKALPNDGITLESIKEEGKKQEWSGLDNILSGNLVIKNWKKFVSNIEKLHEEANENEGGANADYIPQLAEVDPTKHAISVCTIDGQRLSIGDSDDDFCVQSSSKPITYCIAYERLGPEVHNYVATEPSGREFNAIKFKGKLPFNPMINAGAIVTAHLVETDQALAQRFGHIKKSWQKAAGGARIGFDNSVYQSERLTANRNFALGYLMKENGVLPEETDLKEICDLYFQCCSIEVNCETLSVVAATLANGGVCPMTGERVWSFDTVRNCLSLMYSCGLYDYSGKFSFDVGLPGKSGVSGCIFVVIPGVMGMATWSPKLDENGNSVKGVDFFSRLVRKYDFHVFGSGFAKGGDFERQRSKDDRFTTESLISACAKGDIVTVAAVLDSGIIDISEGDYDNRTPLHLAASEGQLEVCQVLVEHGANINAKDRWDGTPISDARKHNFEKVAKYLEDCAKK